MRPIEIRETLSRVPIKVKPCVNDQEIGVATAFIYLHLDQTYLITNYHVVSGRNSQTGEVLHTESGLCPDSLTLFVPKKLVDEEKYPGHSGIRWHRLSLKLFEEGKPIWTEHPRFGPKADVAAIPLGDVESTLLVSANSEQLELDKIQLYPGLEAFVLGFPRGMSGGAHLPIWKRGTIATEPDIDLDGLPKFYIDTATREGMSGAPVYAQEVGVIRTEGGDKNNWAIGKGRRFAGVYSGRIGASDEFKAQLGIVWKESAIIETIEAVPNENGATA